MRSLVLTTNLVSHVLAYRRLFYDFLVRFYKKIFITDIAEETINGVANGPKLFKHIITSDHEYIFTT